MKKLINQPERVVEDMLAGMAAAYPEYVRLLPDLNVVVRADAPVKGKVALVSGGGSGHEPTHGGYVGRGMLDAACAGNVFTSPTPDQVLAAVKAVDGGAGVLLVVKNYTGDVMNFDMAAEMAAAEGIETASVVVNDDVAVENSTYTVGRRGIAGNFFVQKIAGAAAARLMPFERVLALGKKAAENLRSMGMALTSCTVPAKGAPTFSIGEDEMEIGMGLHGEPGIERTKLRPANEVAELLVSKAAADFPLKGGETVAVLINGLGATPLMELYIVGRAVADYLKAHGIKIHRSYVGEFATSMEMAGCSVSLLRLDDELASLLDYPADTLTFKQV